MDAQRESRGNNFGRSQGPAEIATVQNLNLLSSQTFRKLPHLPGSIFSQRAIPMTLLPSH
jgi:hypothetical protein